MCHGYSCIIISSRKWMSLKIKSPSGEVCGFKKKSLTLKITEIFSGLMSKLVQCKQSDQPQSTTTAKQL